MSQTIALVPARIGSRGIPNKNFRELGGVPLYAHAVACARDAGVHRIVMSSDASLSDHWRAWEQAAAGVHRMWIEAGPPLHTDACAMIDVVKDVLARVPGEPDDIWVLLQPTAALRTPERVREAIQLLPEYGMDSVVSVKALPPMHHPSVVFRISSGLYLDPPWKFRTLPARRQDIEPAYIRDGTCYAFYRRTVERYGNIYGQNVRPLIIPPEETCELDTEADWAALEQRWQARG